jgi:hypothetical protein
MTTTLDKLVFLIINRFIKDSNALSVDDFSLLFDENPTLRAYLCNKYLEMPVVDNTNNNALLLIPAINILMFLMREKSSVDYFFTELKDTIEPFKEVYYIENEQKHLVHGLDIFSIVGRYVNGIRDIANKFMDDIKAQQPLNIKSVNQYFNCIHKNKYLLSQFHFKTHANFEVGFELLFLKNWAFALNKSNVKIIKFDPIKNHHIPLHGGMNIELRNISEANNEEIEKCIALIKSHFLHSNKNCIWTEEKIATLLASNDNIIDTSDEVLINLMRIIVNEGVSINKDILSLLFVKNKKVFNDFMVFLKGNKIMIYEESEVMLKTNKDEFSLDLEKIKEMIDKYEKTDVKIVGICLDILKNVEFFKSEKALSYFSEDAEAKFNIESIFHKYLPSILDTYFGLPEKIRNDSNRDFLKMTVEQLDKLKERIQNIEYDVLESEMKKMKIFGSFLDNRFGN